MEKVRPWCGQPSDRGRLRNRTEQLSICGTVCPSISPQHTLQQATEYVFRPTSHSSSAQLYSACVVTLNHLLITWYITYLTNTPQVCYTTCARYSTSSSKFYNKSHYNRHTSKVLTIIMPMTGRKKPQHNKEQLNTLYFLYIGKNKITNSYMHYTYKLYSSNNYKNKLPLCIANFKPARRQWKMLQQMVPPTCCRWISLEPLVSIALTTIVSTTVVCIAAVWTQQCVVHKLI